MTETISGRVRVNKNVLEQNVVNEDFTVDTSATTAVTAIDSVGFETKSLFLSNQHASESTFWSVWASNKASPGTLGGSDWALIGSEITVAASGETFEQWRSPSRWIGVTATAASSASGNSAYFVMKTL